MARIATFSDLLRRLPSWAIACALTITAPAFALSELFETYNAPQALAMGNAFTAVAADANALFYNPAGLARATIKGWTLTPLAIDAISSGGFLSNAVGLRSVSTDRMLAALPSGEYNYFRGNAMTSFTRRGFGVALLGSYEFAALSDGTNIDMNYHKDVTLVVGGATNLFSNMVKLGFNAKIINRNEMRGSYAVGPLTSASLLKEGTGAGADLGVLITLPMSYLPTMGFTWKDMLVGTQFLPTRLLNADSIGTPQAIAQSFNLGVSVQPVVWKGARATISAEIRHLERSDLTVYQKMHLGFQFATQKKLHFWVGLSQMLPSAGIGLRLPGGDFELGTYAASVGSASTPIADRRFTLRYTIGL